MSTTGGIIDGLSDWPVQRLMRARYLAGLLGVDLDHYGRANHVRGEVEPHADRMGADIIVRVRTSPPTTQFSLQLGEIVNNVRGALDSFLWELGGLSGASNSKRGNMNYPAHLTEAEWDNARAKEATEGVGLGAVLPPDLLQRVRETQPFLTISSEPRYDGLAMLARLSNYDKHRGMVLTKGVIQHAQLAMTIQTLGDPAFAGVRGDLNIEALSPWNLEDGIRTLRFGWTIPAEVVESEITLPWQWGIQDPQMPEHVLPMIALPGLIEHADAVMSFVRTGEWPAPHQVASGAPGSTSGPSA